MAGYFLHCCASSVPSRWVIEKSGVCERREKWGWTWVLSSLAQSGGVYIRNPLPNWEWKNAHRPSVHFVGVAGFFPKGKEAFCIYTVQFLGGESIIFSPLLWFPLFLCFASTMVVPFVGFTLLLSLCYGFVPFVMGLCSAFFVFLCLFLFVSGEYCYSVLLFLYSRPVFLFIGLKEPKSQGSGLLIVGLGLC